MKLLALDGNSIANRAYYGVRMLTTSDGRFTNAVFGFLNILLSLKDEYSPDAVAVTFDLKAPTFRHRLYSEYKANRKPMPQELAQQMPKIKEILTAMGFKTVSVEGYEADDILGTFAANCSKDDFCYIATGDRDALQLVTDRVNVLLAKPSGGSTTTVCYDESRIKDEKGVTPKQLIDVKALMGDQSDNIAGVKGIGEVTATALVSAYGDLDSIYCDVDALNVSDNIKNKLKKGKESAYLSRTLGTIETKVPLDVSYDSYVPSDADRIKLKALLSDLEMFRFIERLDLNDVELPAKQTEAKTKHMFEGSLDEFRKLIFDNKKIYVVFDREKEELAVLCAGKFKRMPVSLCGDILKSPEIEKSVFDVKSLYAYLLSHSYEVDGVVFDPMLAGYVLDSNRSEYTLQALSVRHKINTQNDIEDVLLREVSFMPELEKELTLELERTDSLKLLTETELPLSKVLSSMEYAGMKVDSDGIKKFGEKLNDKIKTLELDIYDYAGEEFNINSPKQLSFVLFEKLELPARKKTKTGYSTNADVLESLRDKHPIIDAILEYRTLTKLESTYCDGLLAAVSSDGRIHSTFKQTETRTGRLSSTEPNLQNIPIRSELGREMRKFFTSEDGNVLVDADYSQIELRVLACIADDKNMQEAFNEGEDIHTITASQVFGLPPEMVNCAMRSRAKAVNFGIVYGIGAFSLSRDIGVTVREAKKYIENYLEHYSGVRMYMENVVENAKRDGYVSTFFGRRRYLPELSASNAIQRAFGERVARNMPIQGTAADIIKIAMINVYNRLLKKGMRAKLIMQVHDELIIEAPQEEAQEAERLLKEEMENSVKMAVKFTADANIGKTWFDAKS